MGLIMCYPSADNIMRNTLCNHTPKYCSQLRVRVSSRESEVSRKCCSEGDTASKQNKEYGPSAISLNAVVTLISSVSKPCAASSGKSCVSNSMHHSNSFPKLRKVQNCVFTPTTVRASIVSSMSSTYDAIPMTKILPHLYLGSYDDAINEPELQNKGITHILSLIGNKSPVDFVEHKVCPMHDRGRTELKVVLEKVSRFVELGQKDGNCLLVHCLSGQNRSAVLVIALMMKQKETLYCAHKKVKSLRPIVQINEEYARQLLTLEMEIFGKNSLPCEWMKRGEFDLNRDEGVFKNENVNSL